MSVGLFDAASTLALIFECTRAEACVRCAVSGDETLPPVMSSTLPEEASVGSKRKRGKADSTDSVAVDEGFSTPSAAEAPSESAAFHSITPSSTASRNGSARRKRLSPKLELEPDDAGEEEYDEDADSPDGSPNKKRQSLTGGKWTKYEDECLRAGVEEIGAKNWKAISVRFLKGKRTDVQCLHRWQKVHHLDSTVLHVNQAACVCRCCALAS